MDVVTNDLKTLSRWLNLLDLPNVGPVLFKRWYDALGADFLNHAPWPELADTLKLTDKQRAYKPKQDFLRLADHLA